MVAYTYDATGRLLAKTDATGATIQYTYDALGRVLTKTFPDNTTATLHLRCQWESADRHQPHLSYTFRYDRTNRLTAVTDSRGLTVGYQYDAVGHRTQMTYPDGSVVPTATIRRVGWRP